MDDAVLRHGWWHDMQLTPSTLPSDSNLFSLLVPGGAIAPASSPAPTAPAGTEGSFDALFPNLVSGAPCETVVTTGPTVIETGGCASPLMGALRAGTCAVSDRRPEAPAQATSEARIMAGQSVDGEFTPASADVSSGASQQSRVWTKSLRLPARGESGRRGIEEARLGESRSVGSYKTEIPLLPPPVEIASGQESALPPVATVAPEASFVPPIPGIQVEPTSVPVVAGTESAVGVVAEEDAVSTEVRGNVRRATKDSSQQSPNAEQPSADGAKVTTSVRHPRNPKLLEQSPRVHTTAAEADTARGSEFGGAATPGIKAMSPAGGQMVAGTKGMAVALNSDRATESVSPPLTKDGGGIPRGGLTELPDISAPFASEEGGFRLGVTVPMGGGLPTAMSGGSDVTTAVVPSTTRAVVRAANSKAAEPIVLRNDTARLLDGAEADNGARRGAGFDSMSGFGAAVASPNFAIVETSTLAPSPKNEVLSAIPRAQSFSWQTETMPEPGLPAEAPSDLLVRIEVEGLPSSVSQRSVSELIPAVPVAMGDISDEILTGPGTTPMITTRAGFSTMTRDVALPRPGAEALPPEHAASAMETRAQDVALEFPVEARPPSMGVAFGREALATDVSEQGAGEEGAAGPLLAVTTRDTANSAARSKGDPTAKFDVGNSRVKNFLNFGTERLAETEPALGTDVAKPTATMPSRFFPSDGANRKFEYVTITPAAPAGISPVVAPATEKLEFAPVVFDSPVSPRGAVEAVLQVTEAAQSREQKSVSLQFAVGQENLEVRVELIGGEVRATFHTQSADLHAALAHEWQAAASGTWGAERGMKLSPAVFVAADGSAQNAFSGDAAPRERSSHSRREQAESRLTRSISPASGASPQVESLVPAIASRLGFTGNSLHLHTLA